MSAIEPQLSPKSNLGSLDYNKQRRKKNTYKGVFWINLSIVTLFLNLLPNNLIDPFSYDQTTKNSVIIPKKRLKGRDIEYNSKLASRFQSVDAIVYHIRKHVPDSSAKLEQFELLTKLIRQRFIHAYSVYGMQENWIAVLAGRLIWRDLSAKVIPDDILKGDAAACSQVSIIMMDACRKLSIPTRKVGLKGHYALEALINDNWYYTDANLKPDFNAIKGRKSLKEIIENKEQFKLYANTVLDSEEVADKFSIIEYGSPNSNPAPRAHFFQAITKELSHWGWLIPLAVGIFFLRKRNTKDSNKRIFEPQFLQQFQATALCLCVLQHCVLPNRWLSPLTKQQQKASITRI